LSSVTADGKKLWSPIVSGVLRQGEDPRHRDEGVEEHHHGADRPQDLAVAA